MVAGEGDQPGRPGVRTPHGPRARREHGTCAAAVMALSLHLRREGVRTRRVPSVGQHPVVRMPARRASAPAAPAVTVPGGPGVRAPRGSRACREHGPRTAALVALSLRLRQGNHRTGPLPPVGQHTVVRMVARRARARLDCRGIEAAPAARPAVPRGPGVRAAHGRCARQGPRRTGDVALSLRLWPGDRRGRPLPPGGPHAVVRMPARRTRARGGTGATPAWSRARRDCRPFCDLGIPAAATWLRWFQ